MTDATQDYMLSLLKDLCHLLSDDPLTVNDVQRALAEMPVKAAVEPEPGTDAPAFVRLSLRASGQLTLDSLQEAFGSFRRLPSMHRGAPAEHICHFDLKDMPYTCALIAEKEPDLTKRLLEFLHTSHPIGVPQEQHPTVPLSPEREKALRALGYLE